MSARRLDGLAACVGGLGEVGLHEDTEIAVVVTVWAKSTRMDCEPASDHEDIRSDGDWVGALASPCAANAVASAVSISRPSAPSSARFG